MLVYSRIHLLFYGKNCEVEGKRLLTRLWYIRCHNNGLVDSWTKSLKRQMCFTLCTVLRSYYFSRIFHFL